MEASPLLAAVLEAHGLLGIPSDAEIARMSDDEKRDLYRRQRGVISDYRLRSRAEVEILKGRADAALCRARAMGVPIGDITQQMTRSLPGAIVLESQAAPAATDVPELKPVEPSPLIESSRARKLRKPVDTSAPAPLSTRSYNFTYVDRRLRVINREIAMISKRVKALDATKYRRKPCR